MTYHISRNEQTFGPYSLAELQRYLGTGQILPTDLARSEGLTQWVPVSQIMGNISVANPAPPPPQSYGQLPMYGAPAAAALPTAPQYPSPPNLHWAVLLLLTFVTCGIFAYVWMFVEAAYVGKIDRENKTTILYGIGLPCSLLGWAFKDLPALGDAQALAGLAYLCGLILFIVGRFKIKGSLEDHFTSVEPINLQLSGVMTFFFGDLYFQYHFNRINNWRRTGVLL
jgi:hypothetical protein